MSFHARVAANMLAIVERELANRPPTTAATAGTRSPPRCGSSCRREPEAPAGFTGVRRTEQPLSFARMADVGAGDLFAIDVVDIRGVPTKVFRHAAVAPRRVGDERGPCGQRYLVYGDRARHVRRRTPRRDVLPVGCAPRACGRAIAALATRNLPEWVVAFWAAQAIGAVTVPLNAWWTGVELAYGLADSGSVALFVDDDARSASRRTSGTPRCAPSH